MGLGIHDLDDLIGEEKPKKKAASKKKAEEKAARIAVRALRIKAANS